MSDTQGTKKKTRRKKRALCINNLTLPQSAGFKDNGTNHISVNSIMFAPYCKGWFPRDHVLTRVQDDAVGSHKVAKDILKENVGVNIKCLMPHDVQDIDFRPWFKTLQQFLKKNKKLSIYVHIGLKRFQASTLHVVKEQSLPWCSHKEVFQLLNFVVRHVFPSDLLGSKRNLMLFMQSVKRIVNGCRHHNLGLSSIMHGLRVSEVPWLVKDIPSNALRLHLLSCTVKWFLKWIQYIIRRLWHVTETSPKAGLIFYNKMLWLKLRHKSIKEMIFKSHLSVVPNDVSNLIGWSKLRFMHKPSGLRPISILSVSKEKLSKELISDGKTFLYQILDVFGNSLQFSSFEKNLQHQLYGILDTHPDPCSRPQYYFVRLDIKDAFGSINHSKLMEIIDHVVKLHIPNIDKVEVVHLARKVKSKFGYERVLCKKLFQTEKLKAKIGGNWVDTGKREILSLSPVLQAIRSLICKLGVKDEGNLYQVSHGLPQGMFLSLVLCEIYYTQLDIQHLHPFRYYAKDELFIRYVDDYLFLTPNRERAEKFLVRMEQGFPDFSCKINLNKTLTNFQNLNESKVTFVGYTINLDTFCVEGNFDNFRGVNVCHTMNFSNFKSPGRTLSKRMKIVLKMSPILIDRRLNNKHISLFNLYQVSLLLAFRFHAFVRACFPPKRINQEFLKECVNIGVRQVTRRSRSLLLRMSAGNWIIREEVQWLVYRAFEVRLQAVAAHYQKLIRWIKRRRERLQRSLNAVQLRVLNTVSVNPLPGPFASMK